MNRIGRDESYKANCPCGGTCSRLAAPLASEDAHALALVPPNTCGMGVGARAPVAPRISMSHMGSAEGCGATRRAGQPEPVDPAGGKARLQRGGGVQPWRDAGRRFSTLHGKDASRQAGSMNGHKISAVKAGACLMESWNPHTHPAHACASHTCGDSPTAAYLYIQECRFKQ